MKKKAFIMKYLLIILIAVSSTTSNLYSQKKAITYYLPDIQYNPDIPTPEEVLGYQVGEWHVSHDQLINYAKNIAEASERVEITEYARSHENRPLYYLTISSSNNLANLESLKSERKKLCNPNLSTNVNIDNLPIVIYQGYSIHGNEPSGANASLLNLYYLAAGMDTEVTDKLNNAIILLDPSYNPDGLHRFSSWVNMHKSKTLVSDPNDREYSENWPRGRTNHYWFDLNRDWLLLTHPESQGRINVFHEWKPDILTDHHEMGTNSTFFFQPGVPSRTNPNTPQKNQDLTEAIGKFHAQALDEIGSLYYTKSSFDDYYYGKGSTYPDVNGGIGILFEQASSRGHIQESINGLLTFPFTIRNQVTTSLSTQKAGISLKKEILEYKRKFYRDAQRDAKNSNIKGYIISDTDISKLNRFIQILRSHEINVYSVNNDGNINGNNYEKGSSYMVPTNQYQFKLIKTIFENVTTFQDSLFYDVSAWTMPLAFDLQYSKMNNNQINAVGQGAEVTTDITSPGKVLGNKEAYSYIFEWKDYYTPKALYQIQKNDLRTKIINKKISFPVDGKEKIFPPGSIIIPVQNQVLNPTQIHDLLTDIASQHAIDFYGLNSGYGDEGMTLGNPAVSGLEMPKIMMLVGDGISSYDAGELWHQLDTRYNMPITKIDVHDFNLRSLSRYNTVILVDGSYRNLSDAESIGIIEWVRQGGNLILFRRAIGWAIGKKIISLKAKSSDEKRDSSQIPYAQSSDLNGSKVLGGAIFETEADLTHPLLYGYHDNNLSVFRRGTTFYEPTENKFATPLKYTPQARISGYIPRGLEKLSDGAAAVTVHGKGRGRIIAFQDNLNFRGYWWGGSKLFANALFFSDIISGSTIQTEED